MKEKNMDMAAKDGLFRKNSQKPQKNRLSNSDAKNAASSSKRMVYA